MERRVSRDRDREKLKHGEISLGLEPDFIDGKIAVVTAVEEREKVASHILLMFNPHRLTLVCKTC